MSELHKPGVYMPWEVRYRAGGRAVIVHPIINGRGVIAEVPHGGDGTELAIAELWQWIERAERFEGALRRITRLLGGTAGAWAEHALREEGRL